MTTIREKYKKEALSALKTQFGYTNAMEVSRIVKVTVNTGIGRIAREKGDDAHVVKSITYITGQKPVPCVARKSIASFKTREGQVIGYKITLRGQRMYDFLERFISVAVPRMRDFRGFDTKAVDAGGNLTIGVREHIIFPEMVEEDVRSIFGLEVTVGTNAQSREEALSLFRLLGFPFKKD